MLIRVTYASMLTLAVALLGYPAAFVATHGWAAEAWPAVVGTPYAWFSALTHLDVMVLLGAYWRMIGGVSDAFVAGGRIEGTVVFVLIGLCWVIVVGFGPRPNGRRDGGRMEMRGGQTEPSLEDLLAALRSAGTQRTGVRSASTSREIW